MQAIEFGVGMKSHGYNIYALGPGGTGRSTSIKDFLRDKAREELAKMGGWTQKKR